MATKKNTQRVKVGSVSLSVYPWHHSPGKDYWRFSWTDSEGKRRYRTRATKPEAVKEARKLAKEIHNGALDLTDLDQPTKRLLKRFLDASPTEDLLNEFLAWKKSEHPEVNLHQAVTEMLAIKEANRGLSERNIRSLRGDLNSIVKHIGDVSMASITIQHLEEWMRDRQDLSAKRRLNLRASAVTLWRWARDRSYVPDRKTEAEKLARPKVTPKIPPTYTPDEMRQMLVACPDPYRPWLVCSAFCGLRYEELFPPPTKESHKSPLDWSDFDWENGHILVRPDTAKLAQKRYAALPACAVSWLEPLKKESGRVTPLTPPSRNMQNKDSMTKILGALAGGWKPNGLRNSFISHRIPLVGMAQTALEAGNSESECKRSYDDRKFDKEGERWFSIFRCSSEEQDP